MLVNTTDFSDMYAKPKRLFSGIKDIQSEPKSMSDSPPVIPDGIRVKKNKICTSYSTEYMNKTSTSTNNNNEDDENISDTSIHPDYSKVASATGIWLCTSDAAATASNVQQAVYKPYKKKNFVQPNKELNILLLGETGVGKSTWINGFANYLSFDTLEEAELTSEIICPVPLSFTLTDDNFQQKVVSFGADANENPQKDQSCTQFPRTYCFSFNGVAIRLIDTPGIGDTRGVEQDRENFNNILKHIATFDKLHGICILLKPNNARLNVTFQYCIKQLLTNLHKDASQNIVFCFTNSRSTFYMPGDTIPALQKLLDKKRHRYKTMQRNNLLH